MRPDIAAGESQKTGRGLTGGGTMTATSTIAPVSPRETSAVTAPTQFIETRLETYAYRRFGGGAAPPLVFLQHFTGTLDNWDPAVADELAGSREVVLFEN